MAGINVLDSVKKKSASTKVQKTGWFKETDRHARAAKTGHAGGQYATASEGGAHKSKASSSAVKQTKTALSKFCEVCGKTLN
jgi:hypothetical protein